VNLVEEERYRQDVEHAMLFLRGKNDAVIQGLAKRMDQASADHEYERAARYRDQIAVLNRIQAQQSVSGTRAIDADALAVIEQAGIFCVGIILIRAGRILGGRNFFPKTAPGTSAAEVMGAFLVQHYFSQDPPDEILVRARARPATTLARYGNHECARSHCDASGEQRKFQGTAGTTRRRLGAG
jgi:excinuclease ABC subunit C